MEIGELVRQAKDFVLKHGGHPTLLVASGEKGRLYIYLPDFPSEHEEKILCLFGAGRQAARTGSPGKLDKVFLVMEAWRGTSINIRPSQDPHKRVSLLQLSLCFDSEPSEPSKRQITVFAPPGAGLFY